MARSPVWRFRPIRHEDLDVITAISRVTIPKDPITRSLIEEKTFRDSCFDAERSLVCTVRDQVVAFAPVALCNDTNPDDERIAYVKLFATEPQYQRRGIMSGLFLRMEEDLGRRGARRVRMMDHVHNYLAPGVDVHYTSAHCFLQKAGYAKVGEGVNMAVDLRKVSFDVEAGTSNLAQRKIEVRRAGRRDLPAVKRLLEEHWPAWIHEVSCTFGNSPVSTFIATSGRQVVAFSSCEGNNRGSGWFGPMGTDPGFRRRGIGELLCLLCLRDLLEKGHQRAVIPWVGPIRFYARVCGAEIDRVFWRYEKRL